MKFIIFFCVMLISILLNTLSIQAEEDTILFRFYQKYISTVDGDRCGMYPSCSRYCEQAIKKHGLLVGWIMSCDRLIRCGRDEQKLSDTIKQPDGKLLILDPIWSNDFWWYGYDLSK